MLLSWNYSRAYWTGLTLIITLMLGFNTGQHSVLSYSRTSSCIKAGFSSLSAPPDSDLEDILSEWKSGPIAGLSVIHSAFYIMSSVFMLSSLSQKSL